MSRKLRALLSIGLVSILAGFISIPFVGMIAAIGLFGYSCTPVVTITGASSSGAVSVSKAYFDQFSETDQAQKKAIAALIISIGKERKLSDRSIAIAIGTAIQESNLTNLPFLGVRNDHQSLGIYQQQPSAQWGTAEQIQDPTHAINAFYDALVRIPDRDTRPMMSVAIEVQIPSIDAYTRRWSWDGISTEIVAQNAGSSAQKCATRNVSGTWQVPIGPKAYSVGDLFGERFHPIYHVWKLHSGIDLVASEDTPIYAVSAGVIASAGANGDLGNYVSINHSGGILTGYAHMHKIAPGITKGSQVSAGQLIGYVGTTGGSTGNHLHFIVRVDGKLVDPIGFMSSVGVSLTDNAKG